MKTPRTSLGSLAALASLVTMQEADASVATSAIANVPFSSESSISLDIDGDATNDITLSAYDSSSYGEALALNGDVLINDSIRVQSLNLGDSFSSASTFYNAMGTLDLFLNAGTHFLGIAFASAGQTHFGWLEIESLSPNYADMVVVSAAWETTPNTGITITAVPEPSGLGFLLGIGGGLLALSRRTRRR